MWRLDSRRVYFLQWVNCEKITAIFTSKLQICQEWWHSTVLMTTKQSWATAAFLGVVSFVGGDHRNHLVGNVINCRLWRSLFSVAATLQQWVDVKMPCCWIWCETRVWVSRDSNWESAESFKQNVRKILRRFSTRIHNGRRKSWSGWPQWTLFEWSPNPQASFRGISQWHGISSRTNFLPPNTCGVLKSTARNEKRSRVRSIISTGERRPVVPRAPALAQTTPLSFRERRSKFIFLRAVYNKNSNLPSTRFRRPRRFNELLNGRAELNGLLEIIASTTCGGAV